MLSIVDGRSPTQRENQPNAGESLSDVLGRAKVGAPLTTSDLAIVFGISRQHATKLAAQGAFDQFRLKGRSVGTRHYSGILVTRYLEAEPLAVRTFAAPRPDKRRR